MDTVKAPCVILLNGCSSAGKTSIAHELAERLTGPCLSTGIDDFLRLLPNRLHDSRDGVFFEQQPDGTMPLRLGPVGQALERAFHRAVRAAAVEQLSVVVDDVIFEPWLLDDWRDALHGIHLLFVGVLCPLDELERRERARGDRVIGQARSQFGIVHIGIKYDLEVDTGQQSTGTCVDQIIAALETQS